MSTRPLRLLIIDDSEDDAFFLIRDLKNGGFAPLARRVATSSDLEAALRSEAWDLAVCDYRMPGFDGGAAVDLVKTLKPGLPFLFMSGTLPPDSADITSKADGYISKGHPRQLLEVLDKILPRPSGPSDVA